MEATPARHLADLRPAIKAAWAARLHAEPSAPPSAAALVRPEMLVFLLDATLDRLSAQLALPQDRLQRDLAPFGKMRAGCRCGLHLLLSYYLAGARALHENLPAELGADRVEILHLFNRLAHDEMAALCSICHHRGGEMCSLRQAPPVATGRDGSAPLR